MKILMNPLSGATIKDFYIDKVKYFDSKEGQEFKPGELFRFEDDKVADYLQSIYGFLVELSLKEAKEFKEKKDKISFKCDYSGCSFESDAKIALLGHKRSHEVDLDIPTIKAMKKEEIKIVEDGEESYLKGEAEDKLAGLEGSGLEVETPVRVARF